MAERGIEVDHSTINRWVLKYAPELDKRIRPHLRTTNDSWRVDETYIKAECRRRKIPPPNLLVKGQWKYLYRAVDSEGNTLDLRHECARAMRSSAKRFLRKTLMLLTLELQGLSTWIRMQRILTKAMCERR